jgi:hypothetical protein
VKKNTLPTTGSSSLCSLKEEQLGREGKGRKGKEKANKGRDSAGKALGEMKRN